VIRYKSAKYTIEHPLLIGARVGGAPMSALGHLSDYGLALGEAFQLRDDLLGVFGDPEATGKPAGDDLREGKRTVLVAFALDLAGDADRAAIEALLGREDLDDAGIACLRGIFSDSGAVDRVEEMILMRVDEARAALREVDRLGGLDTGAVAVLADLVGVSTARQA